MGMSPYVRDLRAAVGNARLLLASAGAIVRNSDNAILLVQQRDDGIWSTPGGALELEEIPADAVVRETFEETGLWVRPTRIFAVYGGPAFVVRYPNGDESQYISTLFECEVLSGELRPDGQETSAARFMSMQQAARLPLSPWLAKVLPRLYDAKGDTWFEPPTWRPPTS